MPILDRLLDWTRSFRLDQVDWITRNRLRMREWLPRLEEMGRLRRGPDSLRVHCWGMTPWERGGVEHMLALALRTRGHEVSGTICSGGPPCCSMESVLFPRPPCDYCVRRNRSLLDVFGLSPAYGDLAAFLPPERLAGFRRLAAAIPLDDIAGHKHRGVEVGRVCLRDLPQYWFRLVDVHEPGLESKIRDTFASVLAYTDAALEALERHRPDVAVVTSGKTVSHSGFYEACRLKGIPVLTWDEGVGGVDSFIFRFDHFANEYHLERAWARIAADPLTAEEQAFLDWFFSRTAKGRFGRFSYYKDPVTDPAELRRSLGLDPGRKLLVLLTNLTWDTSALGRDVGFAGMMDWLSTTIVHCLGREDVSLVVRCHPVEGHAPAYARSGELVSDVIARRHSGLPPRIRVVRGEEEHSSHKLAEMSDLAAVYTTNVALEMAMRGRQVLVCGDSHYRGKGFTADVRTREEYLALLADPATWRGNRLTERQAALAKKYAHLFIVRSQSYLPEFHQETRHTYEIADPGDFAPGRSRRWDRLCLEVATRGDFLDTTDFIPPRDEPGAPR